MKTKMINVRMDEDTHRELEWFIKDKGNITITEVVRSAIKEYITHKITWEDVDYKIVPFFINLMKDFKIIGVIKPDMSIAQILENSLPILLCTSVENSRIDFGIIMKQKKEDIFVRVKIYRADNEKIRNNRTETFFMLKRDFDKLALKTTVGEFFNHICKSLKK